MNDDKHNSLNSQLFDIKLKEHNRTEKLLIKVQRMHILLYKILLFFSKSNVYIQFRFSFSNGSMVII